MARKTRTCSHCVMLYPCTLALDLPHPSIPVRSRQGTACPEHPVYMSWSLDLNPSFQVLVLQVIFRDLGHRVTQRSRASGPSPSLNGQLPVASRVCSQGCWNIDESLQERRNLSVNQVYSRDNELFAEADSLILWVLYMGSP